MHSKDSSHMVYTELSPCSQAFVISSLQIQKHGEGLANLVTCSDIRRIRKHMEATLTVATNSQSISQTEARQCSLVV